MTRWLLCLVLMAASACTGVPDAGPNVVTALYPVRFLAERIAGDAFPVVDLAPAGAEPHDLELSPGQVQRAREARVLLYLGKGFQPAVEEIARALEKGDPDGLRTVDLLIGVPGKDPHFWLDPVRFANAAIVVGSRLSDLDDDTRLGVNERRLALEAELTRLHERYETGLKDCARRAIVTSHDAFGLLAKRYGLTQIPVAGIDPEAEPTPQQLNEVVEQVRDLGVTTVFSETLLSPEIAETLARETGAKTAVLDPLENVAEGDDYIAVMDRNLAALREALGCS